MALCAALKASKSARNAQIDYIGSGGELEQRLVEAAGLAYHTVPTGKFRRYRRGLLTELLDVKTVRQNIRDTGRIVRGYRQARTLLKRLQPDVVFVKGGYVGLPVGLAASRLSIPLIIHESDVVMGLTNRILAPRAQIIATGFPVEGFAHIKTAAELVFTGNPIRPEVLTGSRDKARNYFGLSRSLPTLLVIGGSGGSEPINEVVFETLPQLVHSCHVIHSTGQQGEHAARFARERLDEDLRDRYHPESFLFDELADAYAAADVVVTRPSANVFTELATLGKACILIPNPGSANNHSVANTNYIVRRGAARHLDQTKMTARSFRAAVEKLLESKEDRAYLEKAVGKLVQEDAARHLAELVVQLARRGGE